MDPDHLKLLQQGIEAWNAYREKEPSVEPDLSGGELSAANLHRANLHRANLLKANLVRANLIWADLGGANLIEANLVNADITSADLTGCRIYGTSAWGLKLDEHTKQQNLIITPLNDTEITVDNIEVAQFVYLLL